MPDQEMGPDRLVPKGLPVARRGYDRDAVELLLEEARRAWAALQEEHRRLLAEIDRAGGLGYLARDLGVIGSDVGRLLGDAQGAAQGLRERARADAAERVAAAVVEARRLIVEAETQAFHLRADAWAAAESLVLQAEAAHRAKVAEADAEVLVIRAEAEQEAYRLGATARREAQDITRGARFEAERAVLDLRVQHERILPLEADPVTPAAPPAEPAAGRARRRRPTAEPVAPREDVIRVIQPPGARRGDMDPGFYGDALAAEVEALRVSGEVEVVRVAPLPAPVTEPPSAAPAPEEASPQVAAEVPWEEAAPVEAAPEGYEEPEAGEVPAKAVSGEVEEPGAASVASAVPEAAEEAPAPEARSRAGAPKAAGPLDHLFARLRGTAPARPAPSVAAVTPDEAPAAPVPAGGLPAPAPRPDALDLRERLLLPVQNRALRRVKEAIVELQNVTLDALRVSGAWEGPAAAAVALEAALDPVAEEGAEAGAAAAGEFLGGEPPAPVIGARCGSLVQAMAADLATQVQSAVVGAAGAGPLEVAAAVARVFRAWRSDEAERWVRTVAYAAYHDSLLAGLAVSGVGEVSAVAAGLLCPECPAGRGAAWDPAGSPPPGTMRPPAHPGCVCTVAPLSPAAAGVTRPPGAEGVSQRAGLPRSASLPSVPSRPHGRGTPRRGRRARGPATMAGEAVE